MIGQRNIWGPQRQNQKPKKGKKLEKVKVKLKTFVRLKTFQEQVDERKKLEKLKKRTQNTHDSKPSRNLIIGFSIRAIKFVGGHVKATGGFLYTKVHLRFFITPISL